MATQRNLVAMFKSMNQSGKLASSDDACRLGKLTQIENPSNKETVSDQSVLTENESRLGNPTQIESQSDRETESDQSVLSGNECRLGNPSQVQNQSSQLADRKSQSVPKKRKRNSNFSETKSKKPKVDDEKKFLPSWLTDFKWLKYENGAMFCSLCILHKNKSKFTKPGSTNFRSSTLKEHEGSDGHIKSVRLHTDIQSKQIPPVSTCMERELNKIEAAVCRLIRTAYTVAKTHLPISKYADLCKLQLCNDTKLTTKLYQDDTACSVFLSIISRVLDKNLIEKLQKSTAVGIMIDESTDLGTEKHLIVYINYLVDGVMHTSYLTLQKLIASNADVVFNSLISLLRVCKVEMTKVFGFSSDGAAVMLGRENGVVKKLLSQNPYMMSMHCVAHKLALSSLDASKSVREVGFYEGVLHALHSHFSRSSKRLEHLRIWQDILEDPKVKPLAVHQVRWLSFANCVDNVRRTLHSLLKTLKTESEDDSMAESLYNSLRTYKVLFLTHFFSDIMADIAMVSRKFQERGLSYNDLSQTLSAVCSSIEQQYLLEDSTYGENLRRFVNTYGDADTYYEFEIKRSHRDDRLKEVVSEFSRLLVDSLTARFPKLDLWDAMAVFDPVTFPASPKAKASFGADRLAILLEHFGNKRGPNTPPISTDDAKKEWSVFKNLLFAKAERLASTDDSVPVTAASLAADMLKSQAIFDEFPNMTKLMAISRVLPTTSVECERGFSMQNLIKTRMRCSLSVDTLDELIRISVNGRILIHCRCFAYGEMTKLA